ncbi:SUKH-3 domain-containing protein [Streptomyces sp. 549]|uniref:SUKH-3 domain-containing protein n=1 Tax=Streptomyces sp. 549 TaxID=3049076 RepID=UPI0024C21AFD|nr:SUKH-3 domain-containing protein [Streptomyces sp. 549]MDK1475996.1 SUKH-3 domain-containing protein [Streptomyces sp. 549]
MSARFAAPVEAVLRSAGWQPGRWDIRQAEVWADSLRAHVSPTGHRHAVFPAAVEAWAEFGALHLTPTEPGRHLTPAELRIDPVHGLHWARTLTDLGRALGTEIAPLGEEGDSAALLAIDAEGRVYSIDHSGDWYVGPHFDAALTTLVTGTLPTRIRYGRG